MSKANNLERIVERLDMSMTTGLSKRNNYDEALKKLSIEDNISVTTLERLLAICARDVSGDLKHAASALAVIMAVLKKIKVSEFPTLPDLQPSAIAVLNLIKTIAAMSQVDTLKVLCFNTLMEYPDDILVSIISANSVTVTDIIDFYSQSLQSNDIKFGIITFVLKILKTMPVDKKEACIAENLCVWFSKIIPLAINLIADSINVNECVELLELLTESLMHIDYADNPDWKIILECICNPQKYTSVMRNLLESKNDCWHRLWIVFIKLLKNQITKVHNPAGSPINAMLPVVEQAFKMDPTNRCRAFQCWDVLIDNFSKDSDEPYVNKRIKLLIIPLTSSNAKVEATALAKLNTWWHLIRKFHSKVDKFRDTILIPFLQFCFGKTGKSSSKGPLIVPGQFSDKMKMQCLQALVEIIGHVNCPGCVELPSLRSKLISTKILVEYWDVWLHCLKNALVTASTNNSELVSQQVSCLWKSFVMTISELPENNVRKDLFSELLTKIHRMLEKHSSTFPKLLLDILITSLFDDEIKIRHLLKTKKEQEGPINEILLILSSPYLENYCRSNYRTEIVKKLKIVTNFVMDETVDNLNAIIDWLLQRLTRNDNSLLLWTALTESVLETGNQISPSNLGAILLWPIKTCNFVDNAKFSKTWYNWFTLYEFMKPRLNETSIDEEILNLMAEHIKTVPSSTNFMLCISLAIIKHKLIFNNNIENESELFLNILNNINQNELDENIFPILVDTLIFMANKATDCASMICARCCILAAKTVLKLLMPIMKKENNNNLIMFINKLVKSVESLIKIKAYAELKSELAEELVECLHVGDKDSSLTKNVVLCLKAIICDCAGKDFPFCTKIIAAIKSLEGDDHCNIASLELLPNKNFDRNSFIAPDTKSLDKKSKKKEPSIVNRVVENGEEYVVVKSNWKFNPKKLTEHQKEKLKRKREDIPALYQDLSQSQDEAKLTTWKTDSQDTSTTSSTSNTKPANEDVSTILKKIPSADVVPRIMENILSDTSLTNTNVNNNGDATSNNPSITQQLVTVKETKSPRIALKDRVFRNVRNLIEKSGLQKEEVIKSEEINSTVNENVPKTPVTKSVNKIHTNLINSAPPKISERPTRVIKKPKKFDDTEIVILKKRRRSLNDSQPESSLICPSAVVETTKPPVLGPTLEPDISKETEKSLNDTNLSHVNPEIQDSQCIVPNVETDEGLTPVKSLSPTENTLQLDTSNTIQSKETNNQQEGVITIISSEQKECDSDINIVKDMSKQVLTPESKLKDKDESKTSVKKKTSRIEKQLSIDMVEGHPFLKAESQKRITRKSLSNSDSKVRRKNLVDKINKAKPELKSVSKTIHKIKEKEQPVTNVKPVTVGESQETVLELSSESSECNDLPQSEDIIESSQDSTLTTISVKSTKHTFKKVPVVKLDCNISEFVKNKMNSDTQNFIDKASLDVIPLTDSMSTQQESKEDIELPKNKTLIEDKTEIDLTEIVDTEPLVDKEDSSDVTVLEDEKLQILLNNEDTCVGLHTQEIADADTQPLNQSSGNQDSLLDNKSNCIEIEEDNIIRKNEPIEINKNQESPDQDNANVMILEKTAHENAESTGTCSPLKDDAQRKKDFMNDTIEISPIKTLSPIMDKRSPSPETSNDYVVIKLSSPVEINGEPFGKCDSPEIFTEDKISPDKRNQSPPRSEVIVNNTSPSSSLSLKKNRPQVRSSGRAAQMLGLCAPDKLQAIMNSERERAIESEEVKKNTALNTPARRNLRILYNSVSENNESTDTNESNDNFLKFKRSVPTADCSPSGPILKRKLVDIVDEATISPVSKRKRVSFHDPPVSTTIAVQKYIEPSGIRSPQSSALKRQERQIRAHTNMKSPKRLDNVFKLETVLTKAVESFSESTGEASIDDIEMSSLDQTPAVEIFKTSDLNDIDPICPDLLHCNDPIENIASELSSPAMKALFIKELEGKVETIGDLAKMTELEVNRLCIKAPKVKVAKKVLSDYVSKIDNITQKKSNNKEEELRLDLQVSELEDKYVNVEVQTNSVITKNSDIQTISVPLTLAHTQTDITQIINIATQTDESGEKSTTDVVTFCLKRPDFIEQLRLQIDETSVQKLADNLSFEASIDLVVKKLTTSNSAYALKRVLEQQCATDTLNCDKPKKLSLLQDFLCDTFDSKDLILLCSQLLQKAYEKY